MPTAIENAISTIASQNPSRADLDRAKIADDFDQFLLLLTTQLKNQDPTEPMDTNEFTQQLVTFASVEQQIAGNKNLERLVEVSEKNALDTTIGYIGNSIEAEGNAGILSGGQASFVYDLPIPAKEVSVTLLNGAGQAVFSGNGSTNAGKNLVTWDGINSFTGQQLPDGAYYIQVKATDVGNEDIDARTLTTGRVSAVEIADDGKLLLTIGNIQVNSDDVTAVRETT